VVTYDFYGGNTGQHHHLTFKILTKLHKVFLRYEPSKIDRVSLFVFSSFHRCESCHKMQTRYPITLKFDTLKGHIMIPNLVAINGYKVINDCSQKIYQYVVTLTG